MHTSKSTGYHYLGALLATISLLFFSLYLVAATVGVSDHAIGSFLENPVTLLSCLAIIVLVPVISVVYFQRTQQQILEEYINLSILKYVTAFLMFYYGYIKIVHKFFDITYLTQDTRVADVDSFYLTWFFYGRSNIQEMMIGFMEVVPAVLLLFRRTAFLGVVIIFPVAANVLLINIFNHISGLTLPVSFIIFMADIYLLYSYKESILAFLKSMQNTTEAPVGKRLNILRWTVKGAVLGLIVWFIIGGIRSNFHKPNIAYTNKFRGGFELETLEVNHKGIIPAPGDTVHYKNIYLEPQSRWNAVLTFEKHYNPHTIDIKWNEKSDSVTTALKASREITSIATVPATIFKGTYKLSGDKLLVDGIQNKDTIHALYSKKELRDYNWFW